MHFLKIKTLLVIVCAISFFRAEGQFTHITGWITDATSLEPVAFANVYFKGTTTGTTTDFDGFYDLRTDVVGDSLTASFVGYNSASKAIQTGIAQQINFQLNPSMIGLQEVIITPGENPAITLLKQVWAQKNRRNIALLDAYECDSYTKTQVYLRRLFRAGVPRDTSAGGVFNNFSIVSEEGAMPALPVYMSETFSKLYYLRFPEREKVTIQATQTNSLADIETGMLTQLIQKSSQYNFNENHVRILDKNFISPVSVNGQLFYKYYLMDSLYLDGFYCYEVRFIPRRTGDLTFSGTMWINDSTYALKRISVEVGKEANLNFVERIKIQQDLLPSGSGAWYPARTRILADAINIFISAYVVNSNFIDSSTYPLGFYDSELAIADTAYTVSEDTWVTLRPVEPDIRDAETQAQIDALKNKGSVRLLAALVSMSVKGFVNLGKIELGPYLLLYKYNDVEGHRFRLGFRTNSDFSTKWIAKGFAAYGTKDNKLKYNLQLERFLSRKTWTKAGIQYTEDVENLGAFDAFYANSSFLSFASSFGGADKLNQIRVGRLWFETDVFRGFTQKIVFKNKQYVPLSPDYYFAYFTDNSHTQMRSDIHVSEITFTSFYQPKATFIIDKNERIPVSIKKSPVYSLSYTMGLKDIFQSQFSYHKADIGIRHNVLLGSIGSLTYDLKLSKCFSPLPYPLLNLLPANESFFRTEKTYNLMRYGEFITDEAAELFVTFRQDGFILDKIPLIKKLRLRSVATAALAYGNFDEKKNGFYDPQINPDGILPVLDADGNAITSFNSLDMGMPYAEVSYGIENIFKVFRVDAIHRLTYLKSFNNGPKPQKFGVKISAVFRF